MTLLMPVAETAEWFTVSESILRVAKLSSRDDLLEEALEAWLEKAEPNLRWQVALELYTTEQVSSGRAAEIAGLNYFVFEQKLKNEGVAFIEATATTAEKLQQQRSLIHAAFAIPRS